MPAPGPLYNLERLTARLDAPVLIFEDEKAADAAATVRFADALYRLAGSEFTDGYGRQADLG